jgi:hypothetical protein
MGKKDHSIPCPMPRVRLAQAWVPPQPYESIFPLKEALIKGTLFPNLYQPYKPKR